MPYCLQYVSMKTILHTFVALVSCLTMASCQTDGETGRSMQQAPTTQSTAQGIVEHKNVSECNALVTAGEAELLDVRTPGEWDCGHLANATFIDFYKPNFKEKVSELDKDQTYVVYCAVGGRSAQAANQMREMGFKHVINMKGGIKDWARQGLPIEQ